MQHKLINTEDYLLIVDDSEIKKETYCYDSINNILVFYKGSIKNIGFQKVISHLPLNNSPILEGVILLPDLPPLEDEVEKLACEHLGWSYSLYKERKDDYELNIIKYPPFNTRDINIYSNGYKKAKERYNYTEEDIKAAYIEGGNRGAFYRALEEAEDWDALKELDENYHKNLGEFIQSLQQPKMPVGFKREFLENKLWGQKGTGVYITETNSQGLTQWVGEWIY